MQEAVLGGRLTASLPAGRLEYKKRFKLPNGALLALGAGLEYRGGGSGHRRRRRRFKPFLGCQLQFDSGEGSSEWGMGAMWGCGIHPGGAAHSTDSHACH